MSKFSRYAIYFAPRPCGLAEFAAAWLGWDPVAGCEVPHPDLPGLDGPIAKLTETPRKYGFHGTIKPPFRLPTGTNVEDLQQDLAALAGRLAPVTMAGLRLGRLGGFLALSPEGDTDGLSALAAAVVKGLDRHRAAPEAAELARRRQAGLSPRQEAHLARWGYPYVMEEFRFHLTLTGQLQPGQAAMVQQALAPVLEPLLPVPFEIRDLCLFGEAQTGRFHLLHRYALTG